MRPSTHTDVSFIQHPAEIPIGITCSPSRAFAREDVVTAGGLEFASITAYEPGAVLRLRFPTLDPQFVARVRVAWCEIADQGYRVGVTFFDADHAFRLRMLEQIGAIKAHRQLAHEDGEQEQTGNDAAFDWIQRAGVEFPDP